MEPWRDTVKMPRSDGRRPGKARPDPLREPRQQPRSRKRGKPAEALDDRRDTHIQADLGGDVGQGAFERHAAMLGDSRMSQPAYARQRAALVERLQREYGNQYVQRLIDHVSRLGAQAIQTKLAVGPAGDQYEQEADMVAEQVVRTLRSGPAEARRQTPPEEEELARAMPLAQRQVGEEGGELDSETEQAVQTARGQGRALPEQVRAPMESAFGADFSGVRVHTGPEADTLNRDLSARAFTIGRDIFFREGEYRPQSGEGQKVLAHELTHVVQQGGATVRQKPLDENTATGALQRMFSEDDPILEGVSGKQKQALVAYKNDALEAALLKLYGQGFEKRPSGGRLVYLKKGKWADAQNDAKSILGMSLSTNKVPSGGAQKSLEGADRELYSENVLGLTGVIARNFSKSPANATIELHVADVIIEFKYTP